MEIRDATQGVGEVLEVREAAQSCGQQKRGHLLHLSKVVQRQGGLNNVGRRGYFTTKPQQTALAHPYYHMWAPGGCFQCRNSLKSAWSPSLYQICIKGGCGHGT